MGQKYNLEGKKVALLVSDGFEESELLEPRKAIEEAGGTAVVVSTATDTVRAWKDKDWGTRVDVELPLARANPDDFDALVLPGGQMNPDNLRLEEQAIEFIRRFNKAKKTDRSYLPRPVDPHQRRRRARADDDLLAVAASRS